MSQINSEGIDPATGKTEKLISGPAMDEADFFLGSWEEAMQAESLQRREDYYWENQGWEEARFQEEMENIMGVIPFDVALAASRRRVDHGKA